MAVMRLALCRVTPQQVRRFDPDGCAANPAYDLDNRSPSRFYLSRSLIAACMQVLASYNDRLFSPMTPP